MDDSSAPAASGSAGYRGYVLLLMLIGYSLNFLDRQVISIVLQPIKEELHLSDTALGFLSGLSFALFYATLGIPLAAFADRRSRKAVVATSMAVWSVMTALCGLTTNFSQLLLARFGVGIGEAGFTPASQSMIADIFPRAQRGTAVAVTSMGAMLGVMLGLVLGGVVAQAYGWRAAMLVAGAPGLGFAALFWLTIAEPVRGASDGIAPPPATHGIWRSVTILWRIRSYRWIAIGAGLSAACLYGFSVWMPSLLARSYGMKPAAVGLILGPALGAVGALGALGSGVLSDWLMRRDLRWPIWLPAIASLLAMACVIAALTMARAPALIACYAAGYFFSIFFSACTSATIQSLVPISMRATATAWIMLMVNLVGLGLGPQAIGAVSQAIGHGAGPSLRSAMLIATPAFLLPAICYWLASRSIAADMAAANHG